MEPADIRVRHEAKRIPLCTVRSGFKVPMGLANFSKNLSPKLGLGAARVSDLNETLGRSLKIAMENERTWQKITVAPRIRTRVSDLRADLRTDQRSGRTRESLGP